MSIRWMTWVFEKSETRGSHRMVLLALADNANDEGVCWPSLATICKKSRLSKTTVTECLKELEQSGIIVRKRRFTSEQEPQTTYYTMLDNPSGVVNTGGQPSKHGFTGVVNTGGQRVVNTGVLKPSLKPSINHHIGGAKNSADKAPKQKDERSNTPVIQVIKNIIGRYPNKSLYDQLIGAIGDNPDNDRLAANYSEWCKRGYNPNAMTWAIDWYQHGIPAQGKPQKQAGYVDPRNIPVEEY